MLLHQFPHVSGDCAHHKEKQLYLCDTWYLLFCVDNWLVCRSTCSCINLHMFQVTVPIIRRNNCIYGTLGTCYSVWMTGWYVGAYAPASISTCFRWLCAHHQEKQLYLWDTWYLLFCVDDWLVCRSTCSCINLHMFQVTMCPSSGETTVFMGHLVLVILCGWLAGM